MAHEWHGCKQPIHVKIARSEINWRLMAQIGLCVLPTSFAMALGHLPLAGVWLHTAILLFLAFHFLKGDCFAFSTVLLGCIPLLMLLREERFYFNGLTVMLGAGVLLWFVRFTAGIRSCPLIVCLSTATLYWAISFWSTGKYTANLRAIELTLTAANVCLLGRRRFFLSTTILGIWLSVVSMGASMLPYGMRLGRAAIADVKFGNPVTLGVPACLIFLLSIADQGRWLMLQNCRYLRLVVNITALILVLLSTARGSWLIAIIGVGSIWTLGRKRLSVTLWVLLSMIVITAVVHSDRGEIVTHYFLKAASSENSNSARTTGRSRQWAAFPEILSDAPILGHGAGSGVATNIQYTGSPLEWHSLYLQVGVETGTIGLLTVLTLEAWLLWRAFDHWRIVGELGPLVSTLGFIVIGVSISGLDAVSGLFLGFSFLALDFSHIAFISRLT